MRFDKKAPHTGKFGSVKNRNDKEPGQPSRDEPADINHLISQVYDVALDASRYDALRETWESLGHTIQQTLTDNSGPHETAKVLQGHFDRAMIILQQIEHPSGKADLAALVGRFDNVAAFVINTELKIAALNPAAQSSLALSVGGGLADIPVSEDDEDVLTRQVRKMLNGEGESVILRVRSRTKDSFLIFQIRLMELNSGERVLLAVTSDLSWPDGFNEILRDAFLLSSAEAEVVRLLIDCCSVKEIAELRGRSIDTIRAQVKAILAKTETNSQVELVRLVLSMMDIASTTLGEMHEAAYVSGGGSIEAIPYRTVYDASDRRLDYLVYGDPNGRPLLYIAAEYCYLRWTTEAEAWAKANRIKVIAPVRAGYGKSDLLPKKTDFCSGITNDLFTVLDAEGATSVPVITIADEHNYAIQMEKERPGTVRAVVAAGGALPFTNEAQVQRMHKWYRFIQACARYTPNMLPYMLRMGFHLVVRVGKESFFKTIYEDSPADVAALNDKAIFAAIDEGSEPGMEAPTTILETFARQQVFEQSPTLVDHVHWARDKFPVHFMCGLEDPSQPKETLEENRAIFDWIDYTIYPNAGQLLLFTQWRDVLTKASEYLD